MAGLQVPDPVLSLTLTTAPGEHKDDGRARKLREVAGACIRWLGSVQSGPAMETRVVEGACHAGHLELLLTLVCPL